MIARLIRRLPHREIHQTGANDHLLLRRYFILRTKWLGIYVHELVADDYDRALHDHPWSFLSIILSGQYSEVTNQPGAKHYHRGSVKFRPAEYCHQLYAVYEPTWTLVIRGRRRREWGFITPKGWMRWDTYETMLLAGQNERPRDKYLREQA